MNLSIVALVQRVLLHGTPKIQNPSFEEDTFTEGPGYAAANGGSIIGWESEGRVGINPYFTGPEKQPMGPFTDNGVIPDGRQVAVCHENGRLWQEIADFEAGKQYVVTYYENARHNNRPLTNPTVELRLGGEVIVSKHAVPSVDDMRSHQLAYAEVTSAPFTAPEDGTYVLEFIVEGKQASALIDNVSLRELAS